MAWVVAAVLAAGCARQGEAPAATGSPGADADAQADATLVPVSRAWRDLDAAVSYACGLSGLAPLRTTEPEPGVRRYELVTMHDEEATLIARAPAGHFDGVANGAAGVRAAPVRETALEMRIGAFGDPGAEARFIERVRAWKPAHKR